MKWILIALLLLALAFIVYAVAGRRGTAAGREAAADLRGLGRTDAGAPSTPGAPVPPLDPTVGQWTEPESGDPRPTIFDGPPPADESDDARHEDTATTAGSGEPEEGDMFGWGKDKKDGSEDAVVEETTTREASSDPEANEGASSDGVSSERVSSESAAGDDVPSESASDDDVPSEDYVPRRGAGIDEEETADQPSWTTSAHDADHTVAEERSDGERTTFDEDSADSGAQDDREASDAPPQDEAEGVAGDQGEGAADLREEQVADGDAEQGAGSGDADESAAQGSQEAYEAGQRAGADTDSGSGDVAADDDALEGAQDGSVGAEVLHGGGDSEEPDDSGASNDDGSDAASDSASSGGSDSASDSGDEEPADSAEFRQRGDWVAGDGDAEVQTAEEAAELRGGPTVLSYGTVAGPEQSGDGESGDPDARAAVASDSGSGDADSDSGSDDSDSGTHSDSGSDGGDSGLGAGDATGTEDGAEQMDAEGAAQAQGGEVSSDGGSADGSASDGSEGGWTRRTSDLDEVRDGGYGVGSAATFEDRAMPLGHPVKAWEDTRTFVDESHPAYDEAEPHVWFADTEAAERAGFRRVD